MAPMPLRVAIIAAECEPWAKTGGLGDVVDALARALGQAAAPRSTARSTSSCRATGPCPVPDRRGPRRTTLRVPDPRALDGIDAT